MLKIMLLNMQPLWQSGNRMSSECRKLGISTWPRLHQKLKNQHFFIPVWHSALKRLDKELIGLCVICLGLIIILIYTMVLIVMVHQK